MVEENQNQPHISDKRIKSKEEDGISSLPDCLIIDILSRLPSTEIAIKTGTLSKRWNNLWTFVPCLVFAFDDLFTQRPYDYKRRRFFYFVNKTLNQCRQLNLKKFDIKLHTSYDSEVQSQVENWIRYAISCNVQELNIKLWVMHEEADFEFDESFFVTSCFTRLKLSGCLFNPAGSISWKNLNTLYIQFGTLDEDLIENILSGSPVLETLVLDNCYGYSRLDITSKSVKNLVISGYEPPGFEELCNKYSVFHVETDEDFDETIEINAPNILSLTIKDDLALWKLLLLNVSSLVKVDLDYDKRGFYEIPLKEEEQMLKELILKLGHVKELNIGKSCSKVLSRLEAKGFILPLNKDYVHVASLLCRNDDLLELGN